MTSEEIKNHAMRLGVKPAAIRKRVWSNIRKGNTDLLATGKGGNYKITEKQAAEFWRLVQGGATTKAAAKSCGITNSQAANIRNGLTWNHITGKKKPVYDY